MGKGDVLSIRGGKVLVLGPAEIVTLPSLDSVSSEDAVLVLEELKGVLQKVYEINEEGGHGSRKAVRELLTPYLVGNGGNDGPEQGN